MVETSDLIACVSMVSDTSVVHTSNDGLSMDVDACHMACWTAAGMEAVRVSKLRFIIQLSGLEVLLVETSASGSCLVRHDFLATRVEKGVAHGLQTCEMSCT